MAIKEAIKREITKEIQKSYLEYAMSVIVARALPDARDGLKPVHRRILYSMHEMGLRPGAKFQKSAKVVGYVLGQYHPHGDTACYDAMVRMAQDFSLRYPLVQGQGNFGNIDGDSPAAYRYTEARQAKIAQELLADIDKETVDFRPNFDSTSQEPSVLPTRVPNLLVNGSMGIAVGMATNIPPHNLGEVLDALMHLIEEPDTDVRGLMKFVKGPDFPTGGSLYNEKDLHTAYATGKGPVICRGTAEIVEGKRGFSIIITEIPYQVVKADLIKRAAELVKAKKLEGIKDIRDESAKDIRIVVELKQDAFPKKVLNALYKYTELQKTFHFNMLALVGGIQPQVMGLKPLLEHFVEHRKQVVTRRSRYELERAKERAHILEGLKKALDHIDKIIAAIKKSATREEAHANLMKKFRLSDRQATAILEMQLQKLAGLERKKIEDELKEKKKLIAYLEALLKSPKKILGVVKTELKELKEVYADERRTRVIKSALREIGDEELVPEEDALFMLTRGGYIKRLPPDDLRAQKRGGKGLIGMATKEEDVVSSFFLANTHDSILFFTDSGKVFQVKGHEVPEASRQSKGRAIANFIQVGANDTVTAVVPVPKDQRGQFLFMTTTKGIIKKVPMDSFENVRRNGILAINLKGGDRLGWVLRTSGDNQVVLTTAQGSAIRFSEKDVRPMGRSASGVLGMRLSDGDHIVGADIIATKAEKGLQLLVVMANGFGKRTALTQYKVQKRGGRGILTANITAKTGNLVSAHVVSEENKDIIAVSGKGQVIRTAIDGVSVLSRATQGVRIMRVEKGDKLALVVLV
jgi:DNA gyrase subunit A